MQMAQIIGGYSLGGADLLRRAMGKKKADEMATHREIFAAGAAKNGLSVAKANELFDLMEKFAGYGFNKSHAAAYALLAYHTAWLKVHFPAEFMAANLSASLDDTDKIKVLIDDGINRCGLTILPPDINVSDYRFTPVQCEPSVHARAIRYGLGAVKGTGQAAIEIIVRARKEKPFVDLFDFCSRIDKRLVNRRVIEALIRAGAFDRLELDRASLLASVGKAIETAEQAEANIHQVSLFEGGAGAGEADTETSNLVRVRPWSEKQRLAEEKAALGFYLSGHLFQAFKEEVRHFSRTPLSAVQASREPQVLAGIISAVRTQMTRRGRMLVVRLDDGSGQLEVTVFNELYEANRQRLREDELLVVQGQVRNDDFTGGLRMTADKLFDLTLARTQYARGLRLSMNGDSDATRLKQVLLPHLVRTGSANPPDTFGCPVTVCYFNGVAQCEIALGADWRIVPDEALAGSLSEWLAATNVEFQYP